ncbi:metallophosphatase family protein [bacterium]|nr:metallophosphatase family protein [bacterium]MBU1984993.1 metallophosphatase family protein [bacterium]
MKLGLLSDIHSNLEALEVVLRRFESEKVDRIYCLGDIVGYGASPNECVDRIRTLCYGCIMGNHDDAVVGRTSIQYFNPYARVAIEWTSRVLTEANLEYLQSLPMTRTEDGVLMVHATPGDPERWNYILQPSDAVPHFKAMKPGATAFIGHSHITARFEDPADRRRIINVGSVGQPRDRDPRAACGVYDTETGTYIGIREVYPIQEASRRIRQANLPEFLAARLFIGM